MCSWPNGPMCTWAHWPTFGWTHGLMRPMVPKVRMGSLVHSPIGPWVHEPMDIVAHEPVSPWAQRPMGAKDPRAHVGFVLIRPFLECDLSAISELCAYTVRWLPDNSTILYMKQAQLAVCPIRACEPGGNHMKNAFCDQKHIKRNRRVFV